MGEDEEALLAARPSTTVAATWAGDRMPSRPAVDSTPASPTEARAPPVMAVATAWGHRHENRTPESPCVIASHSARPTTACLVTEYGAEPSWVSRPAADAVCSR